MLDVISEQATSPMVPMLIDSVSEQVAAAELAEARAVSELAVDYESAVVAIALGRAMSHPDGSIERKEADEFAAWAAETKASVTAAAMQRQKEAERAYEEVRRQSLERLAASELLAAELAATTPQRAPSAAGPEGEHRVSPLASPRTPPRGARTAPATPHGRGRGRGLRSTASQGSLRSQPLNRSLRLGGTAPASFAGFGTPSVSPARKLGWRPPGSAGGSRRSGWQPTLNNFDYANAGGLPVPRGVGGDTTPRGASSSRLGKTV